MSASGPASGSTDWMGADLRRQAIAFLRGAHLVNELRFERPALFYGPSAGQLAFHQARHPIRAICPGNGWGKTRAAGTEVNWWLSHRHPYQPTPKHPVQIIWCCETYKQFALLRQQLEAECFDRGWTWHAADKFYSWPDGGQLWLISGDSSWTHVQGINPDLVEFDEEPPLGLWAEMQMRRRGRRKTRYCFSATATQGITWMYHQLYLPWLKAHQDQGISETDALIAQAHPLIWCWPTGGIGDNPGASAEDKAWYLSRTYRSKAERDVRLGGGFRDFSGTPVFDAESLDRQEPNLSSGRTGRLVEEPKGSHRYLFLEDGPMPRGRLTIYEMPDRTKDRYVIGHDSALGLEDKDYDYAVVLGRNSGRVVAEAQGRWGDSNWADVLAALYWFYGCAFMLGERQGQGLMTMRRLYDEYGVSYQYYNRREEDRGRPRQEKLGHARTDTDLTIPTLRRELAPRNLAGDLLPSSLAISSPELLRQLRRFSFQSTRATLTVEEATDSQLIYGAPKGDHDDGVFALAYATKARREVAEFEEEEAQYPEGTYGHQFQIAKVLARTGRQRTDSSDPFAREDG